MKTRFLFTEIEGGTPRQKTGKSSTRDIGTYQAGGQLVPTFPRSLVPLFPAPTSASQSLLSAPGRRRYTAHGSRRDASRGESRPARRLRPVRRAPADASQAPSRLFPPSAGR